MALFSFDLLRATTHECKPNRVMSDIEALMLEVSLMLNIGHGVGVTPRISMYCRLNQYYFLDKMPFGVLYFTKP